MASMGGDCPGGSRKKQSQGRLRRFVQDSNSGKGRGDNKRTAVSTDQTIAGMGKKKVVIPVFCRGRQLLESLTGTSPCGQHICRRSEKRASSGESDWSRKGPIRKLGKNGGGGGGFKEVRSLTGRIALYESVGRKKRDHISFLLMREKRRFQEGTALRFQGETNDDDLSKSEKPSGDVRPAA